VRRALDRYETASVYQRLNPRAGSGLSLVVWLLAPNLDSLTSSRQNDVWDKRPNLRYQLDTTPDNFGQKVEGLGYGDEGFGFEIRVHVFTMHSS
jgi:hypothetical protein